MTSRTFPRRRWFPLPAGSATALVFAALAAAASAQLRMPERMPSRLILPGDRLRIVVEEQASLSKVYSVAGDGTIDFGFVGRVYVAERMPEAVADALETLLETTYFKDATVRVSMAEFVEGSVTVLGEVRQPGQISFESDQLMTLVEAIARQGGLTEQAAGTDVRVLRWSTDGGMQRQVITVDVQRMLATLDFSQDQFLRPRDIVLVPRIGGIGGARAGGEYLVLGEVAKEGFHPHFEKMDMIRAITSSGGIARGARMDSVRVLRPREDGEYDSIPVNLALLFGAADMRMNVPVMAGDIIFVPSQEHAQSGTVYLLGQVKSVGAASLPIGGQVTLARLILSRGGFTEFANDSRVRLLRRDPSGAKRTMVLDVGSILKTGAFEDDVPLVDGDVVIVPEKIFNL